MAEKKKVFELSDLLKILGVLALFIPLMTAALQYRQSVLQQQNEKFRSIVEELSSENEAKRLAAASKMGIFIERGFYLFRDKYYDDAVDILVNRTSVELDYNVLNAIMGALKKARKKDYNKIVEKLFDIERNFFIQEYPIDERIKTFDETLTQIESEYITRENRYKKENLKLDSLYLDNLKPELKQRQEDYFKTGRYKNELKMHKLVISDFLSVFLRGRDSSEQLKLFRNSLNNVVLADLDLRNLILKMSAIGSSTISETKFDNSEIIDTVFTFSDLTKSSFKGCKITASLFDRIPSLKGVSFSESEFNDVFFVGSDLTGADFQKVKGQLLPVHFYEVRNFKDAKFDDEKLKTIEKKITEDEFIEYVIEKSELSKARNEDILQSLDELRNRVDYFTNAVIVYAYLNKKDAKLAARTAWMVASKNTQKLMSKEISKLKKGFEGIKKELKTDLEIKGIEVIINVLSDFEEELKGLIRSIDNIKVRKKELSNINQKYLDALEKGNAKIFSSEYRDLFLLFKKLKLI